MSSSVFVVATSVALFVALVSGGPVTLSGNCPDFEPKQNLESSRLSGDWIGLLSLKNGIDKPQPRCLKSNNQIAPDGVMSINVQFTKPNNEQVNKSSVGTPTGGQKGKLAIQSTEHPEKTVTTTILATDYDNYLVVVNCKSDAGKHGYSAVILSRQPSLAPELMEEAKAAVKKANINEELLPIDQSNC